MHKTLADLKRDINIGDKLQLIEMLEDHAQTGLVSIEIPEKLKPVRTVSYKDTTGFYLKADTQTTGKGSFFGYPKATDMTYNLSYITITERDTQGNIWQKRIYQLIK